MSSGSPTTIALEIQQVWINDFLEHVEKVGATAAAAGVATQKFWDQYFALFDAAVAHQGDVVALRTRWMRAFGLIA